MGGTSTADFNYAGYKTRSATYAAAPTAAAAFKARSLDPYLDPSKFQLRESRNSPANPKSTPVMIGFDVTGSMGSAAHDFAKAGLGTLIKEIVSRKPVSDPHIGFCCIGDTYYDRAPLQVSQFETDLAIMDQLDKIWVEGGGGGNQSESYTLPWHFAAFHTSADAFEKDGRKGFLLTIGDEFPPADLTQADLTKVYGRTQEPLATNKQLLEILADKYHVFHLMTKNVGQMTHRVNETVTQWQKLLGQHAIIVDKMEMIPEVVVSLMQVVNGEDEAVVAKSWSGDTALVVANAIRGVGSSVATVGAGGLVRF